MQVGVSETGRHCLIQSLLGSTVSGPDTGGRGRRVTAKTEEGGKEGERERGGAGCVYKAGCESPQGEERRG